MNISFDRMESRKRRLYRAFWENNEFVNDLEIRRTVVDEGHESDNSYSFLVEGNPCNSLMDIFGIEYKTSFENKYRMAVSGSGQEWRRITTLHSSSLCALLHFYNIEEYPLVLTLNTNRKARRITFTRSFFEYQSPVFNNPSNMDIVLLGNDDEGEVALFLESKFSEYYLYSSKSVDGISNKYREEPPSAYIYQEDVLKKMGLAIATDNKGGKSFKLVSLNNPFYIAGIKQMVSHYCGITNAIKNPDNLMRNNKKEPVSKHIKSGKRIILGEILFDNKIQDFYVKPNINCLRAYSEKYEILANYIGECMEQDLLLKNRFEIVKEDLRYSDLFMNNPHIEANIKRFYYS